MGSSVIPQATAAVWGVDSARRASDNALDGTDGLTSVTQRAGAAPVFWGRYIGGNYSLTAAEAAFLHAGGCKILLVYNGTTNTAGSVQGGFAEGQTDANNAAIAAAALNVPPNTAVYADIEGSWAVTPDWLRGCATAMVQSVLVPGLYCNCDPASAFSAAYCTSQAIEPAVAASLLWSMEPEPDPQCQAAAAAPGFVPAVPACGGNVVLWQYTEGCWEDTLGKNAGIDMDLATNTAIASMW